MASKNTVRINAELPVALKQAILLLSVSASRSMKDLIIEALIAYTKSALNDSNVPRAIRLQLQEYLELLGE